LLCSTSILNILKNKRFHSTSILWILCSTSVCSLSFLNIFGISLFIPVSSLTVLEYLCLFLFALKKVWNTYVCSSLPPKSCGIPLFVPFCFLNFWNTSFCSSSILNNFELPHLVTFCSSIFWNRQDCFTFASKISKTLWFASLWSCTNWNTQLCLLFAPIALGIKLFDPLCFKKIQYKEVRFASISKQSEDRSFVSLSFRYRWHF